MSINEIFISVKMQFNTLTFLKGRLAASERDIDGNVENNVKSGTREIV